MEKCEAETGKTSLLLRARDAVVGNILSFAMLSRATRTTKTWCADHVHTHPWTSSMLSVDVSFPVELDVLPLPTLLLCQTL